MADDVIREEPERDAKRGMKNSLRLKKEFAVPLRLETKSPEPT